MGSVLSLLTRAATVLMFSICIAVIAKNIVSLGHPFLPDSFDLGKCY
ncbi:MAG: hypothetical protein ACPLOV_11375 [Thermovenabulum sp.]